MGEERRRRQARDEITAVETKRANDNTFKRLRVCVNDGNFFLTSSSHALETFLCAESNTFFMRDALWPHRHFVFCSAPARLELKEEHHKNYSLMVGTFAPQLADNEVPKHKIIYKRPLFFILMITDSKSG